MIEKLVRKNILNLKPYTSARDSYLDGILLDANENSFGSVVKDEHNLKLNRYPDPAQNELREKLASHLNVSNKKLFFGVGSDEIIDLLIRIFCDPQKDSVVIPTPTYGMYQVACDVNNIKVINVPLKKTFQIDVQRTLQATQNNTKIIFLCSPNNPTGNLLKKKDVLQIVKSFKGIVIVDEAYVEFCEEESLIDEISKYKNLVITRTFSKAWGLAGVRCGFSIADEFITNLLFKIKAPYNMNKLTAKIVLEAMAKVKQKDRLVNRIITEREKLIEELRNIKQVQKILQTDSNFITFRINNASSVFKQLAAEGIIIRDRSNQLNMKNCLRISVGTVSENKKFIKELKNIVK